MAKTQTVVETEDPLLLCWLAVTERKHCGRGQSCPGLVVAAQQLHAQGDALVPLPGEHAHVPGVEGRLKDVLLVGVVVHVALEKLQRSHMIV